MDPQTPMNAPQAQSTLQAVDVFTLLGTDGTAEEKEAFLSELQDAIWEQVVEKHLMESLSEEDINMVDDVLGSEEFSADQKREKLYEMLSVKLPNLEQIISEETLSLKQDLLDERVQGMRFFYKDNADALQKIDASEDFMNNNQYSEGLQILNSLIPQVPAAN